MNSLKDVPHFAFEEIYNLLGEKTRKKLLKHILSDSEEPKVTIIEYIRELVDDVFFINGEGIGLGIAGELSSTYYRRIQTSKKNWYKQLKKDVEKKAHTPIHAEREMLEFFVDSNLADEHITDSLMNVKEPNKFIEDRLNKVKEWAMDRNSRLTDYLYLDSLKHHQIEKAFKNDIVYIVCNYFKNSPKQLISHGFKDIIENPIFADGRMKMKGEIVDGKNNKKMLVNEYKITDDQILKSMVSLEPGEELEVQKTYYLDDIDEEIFEFAMENRDDDQFYTENKIVFDLRPLLLRIYGNTGKKAYENATKRLKKIGRFSFEGRKTGPNNEVISDFLINLFQKVNVNKDPASGRIYVEIVLSDDLHQEFIEKKTVMTYTPLLHRLENKLAKRFLKAFQLERIQAYLDNREIQSYYSYSYFTSKVRFRTKKVDSTLKKIEEALQDLKNAEIFLKDFKRLGKGFEVELTPLTETEKRDFFAENRKPEVRYIEQHS